MNTLKAIVRLIVTSMLILLSNMASAADMTLDQLQAQLQGSEAQDALNKLIGKTVYKVGFTELLNPTLSIDDFENDLKRRIAKDRTTKNFTPLKIVDGKVLDDQNTVVVKVQLPGGDTRLLYGNLSSYAILSNTPPLERMSINAIARIPSAFSKRELAAIRDGNVYRGMSRTALVWSWGFPTKTNNYGSGGEQLIYGDSTYVYVRGTVVTDWQAFDQ